MVQKQQSRKRKNRGAPAKRLAVATSRSATFLALMWSTMFESDGGIQLQPKVSWSSFPRLREGESMRAINLVELNRLRSAVAAVA